MRPVDWYPLAYLDPVAGDPDGIRGAGHEYRRVAWQIAGAADDLRQMSTELAADRDGGSAAVAEVEAKAARLADTIERAHARYVAAGDALLTYADALAAAQEASLVAYDQAVAAVRTQDVALDSIRRWSRLADDADDPQVERRYLGMVDHARTDLAGADTALDTARATLRTAVASRDEALALACAAIRGAMARDDLHDTIWQDLGGGVQEAGLAVWNGVDEIADALTIASVALSWLPGANAVLGAGATIAGAALLLRDSVDYATGNGSAQDVRASALGVATFGVGRFAAKGIELSVAATRGGRAARQLGLSSDAADVGPGVAQGSGRAVGYGAQALVTRTRATDALRSPVLWSHMRPSTVARDTWQDLRGGVDLVRAPGLYRPSASGHVQRPVDTVVNPLREYRTEVAHTWAEHKGAGVFAAVGNESAARALSATKDGAGALGWATVSGGVQVVETVSAWAPLTPDAALSTSIPTHVARVPAEDH